MALKWKIKRPASARSSRSSGDERRQSISARIVKAFSGRSVDEKSRPAQTSPLLNLPYELLDHILLYVPKTDLRAIRATCYHFDELLLDRVFGEVSINCNVYGSQRTGALIRQLASGKARVSSVATTLRVANIVPFTHPIQSNWQEMSLDTGSGPIQQSFVAPALRSFKNVETVHWHVKISDPYSSMCDALSSLPSLRNLHLKFERWTSSVPFPFDKFLAGRLRRLHVEPDGYIGGLPLDRSQFHRVVQSSADLESLVLTIPPQPTTFPVDLAAWCPSGLPLTSLRILPIYLPEPPAALWAALPNLTSLDIVDEDSELHSIYPSIWRNVPVQLQSIKVANISSALLDYLITYSGLQELCFKEVHARSPDERQVLISRLYQDVLPLHRHSLHTFRLYVKEGPTHRLGWGIDRESLASLMQCSLLRDLQLPIGCANPASEMPIQYNELINSLSRHLPHLRSFHLIPILTGPEARLAGFPYTRYSRMVVVALMCAIRETIIEDPAACRFVLKVVGHEMHVERSPHDGRYRFLEAVGGPIPLNGSIDGVHC